MALPIRLFGSEIWTLRKKTDIDQDEIFQKNRPVHHFVTQK